MEQRSPAVAGMFYPSSKEVLQAELDALIPSREKKRRAIGVISPHAGYIYSGAIAGELIASIDVPGKIIIIGPNHTGLGSPAAVMPEGVWHLPNGAVAIDSALAAHILKRSNIFTPDSTAHRREHSIEVQIPLLLHVNPEIEIVPITLMPMSAAHCKVAGLAIAEAIRNNDGDVLILASSDMTHYESAGSAKRKDLMAIEKVLDLDPEGLIIVVAEEDISMCGLSPSAVMLFAAKELGAEKASLVRYANSGDVSGDYGQVVGYAGIMIE